MSWTHGSWQVQRVTFTPYNQEKGKETPFPERETYGSVGYDLYTRDELLISPFSQQVAHTGWNAMFPPGTYGQIQNVSSLPYHLCVTAVPGVIDPDYDGEIIVTLINHTQVERTIRAKTKIAQLVVTPYVDSYALELAPEARATIRSGTSRGKAGCGLKSTDNLPQPRSPLCCAGLPDPDDEPWEDEVRSDQERPREGTPPVVTLDDERECTQE